MSIRDVIPDGRSQRSAPVAVRLTPDGVWQQQRRGACVSAVLDAVDRLADGASAADCAELTALFAPGGAAARRWVAALLASPVFAALADNPLSGLNLAQTASNGLAQLRLAGDERVSLTLVLVEGSSTHGIRAGQSTLFQPMLMDEVVLAGAAEATMVSIVGEAGPGAVALAHRRVALQPGAVLSRDARREHLVLDRFAGQLVTLRLCRRTPDAVPAREIDLDSGRIVHTAAADVEDSRRDMMIALIGRMGRREAAPVLARLARAPGTLTTRWQALRECLALDTAAGFIALTAIARDAADPLAVHAGALRAQLVETHPALETIACPA